MEVKTIELFSREFEVVDMVVQFSTINNEKGLFIIYINDKANEIFYVSSLSTYFLLFNELEKLPIEEKEKVEFISEITSDKYKDYWLTALNDENLNDTQYMTTDGALAEWEEYKDLANDDSEKRFWYSFNNESFIQIVINDDGEYDVSFTQVEENKEDDLQIATFNNFENMVYGIAPFCQKNFEDQYEMAGFVSHLYYSLVDFDEDVEKFRDELGEMIMK